MKHRYLVIGRKSGKGEMSFGWFPLDSRNPWPRARRNISDGFVLKGIYSQVPHGSERTLQTSLQ